MLRQIHTVAVGCLALIAFGVPFTAYFLMLDMPCVAAVIALTVLVAIANLVLLRRIRNPILCGHIAVAAFYVVLVVCNIAAGGFDSVNFSWFYLMPIGAFLLLGWRGGLLWLGGTLITCLGFWLASVYGVTIPNQIPEASRSSQALISRLGAVLGLAMLMGCFVVMQRRT